MTITINADDLPRFMTCNGSRLLPGVIPATTQLDTTARDEGTAAHHMAMVVYRGEFALEELVDRKAPNGVYMTLEMAGHVANYLQILQDHHTLIGVELDTSHQSPGSNKWTINGRTDFIGLKDNGTTLHVVDFKYGWRIVQPDMDWRLISHAIGFLRGTQYRPSRIRFSIFQPRPWHPDGNFRSWEISFDEFCEHQKQLDYKLSEPNDQLQTSNHCANCHALATCPAARKADMNSVDWLEQTAYSEEIDNDQLSFQLDTLYRIQEAAKQRLKALEELAQHRIKGGAVIENYSVVISYHNTSWKEGTNAKTFQIMTGHDISAEPRLVSPAEAKRRGVNGELIKAMTERLPSGIKLVRSDANKRGQRLFEGNTKGN